MALTHVHRLPPVRLLACDLDGTLVGPDGEGLQTARTVADYCRAKGVRFTIATGRVLGSVGVCVAHLGQEDPVITNGGAVIASPTMEPLWEKVIDAGTAASIALELRHEGLPFYFITPRGMATEWKGPETAHYSRSISYSIEVVSSLTDMALAPTQIVVRVPPEDAVDRVLTFQSRWSPRVTVLHSLPHLVEFQAEGVSKAKALEELAMRLGVEREEVLAIGDSLNDIDMLAWAGRSACVGNAHPDVARRVGIVATKPHSEGVFEVVKKTL